MKYIFDPKSVALIGATDRPGSVGKGLAINLLEGKKKRDIFLVNPNRKKVLNKKTYPQVKDIKQDIDLAVIAVPAKIVLKIVKECCEKKVKAVIIISSGFAETGAEGAKLQKQIQAFANLSRYGSNWAKCARHLEAFCRAERLFRALNTEGRGHSPNLAIWGALGLHY